MKFSKDNRPTEPGWWWANLPWFSGGPIPIEVEDCGMEFGLMFKLEGNSYRLFEDKEIEWGDRIETPPVDGIEAGGG